MKPKSFQVTDEQYRSEHDYISITTLKRYKQSPLHKKEYVREPPTPALIFGAAAHCFILEPKEIFEHKYFVYNPDQRPNPDKTFQNTQNKMWQIEQQSRAEGREILDLPQFLQMKMMKKRLMADFYCRSLITKGLAEQGFFTKMNGVKVKVKPDYLKDNAIIEYKTIRDASLEQFKRDLSNWDWHIQIAYFKDVMEHIDGKRRTAIFIAQEKSPPYAHAIYKCSHQLLSVGTYEYEALLEQHKYCLEADDYRGYGVFADNKYGLRNLDVPAWKIKELKFYNQYE